MNKLLNAILFAVCAVWLVACGIVAAGAAISCWFDRRPGDAHPAVVFAIVIGVWLVLSLPAYVGLMDTWRSLRGTANRKVRRKEQRGFEVLTGK